MAILDFIKPNQTSTSAGTVSVTSTQPIVPQYIATKPAVQLVPEDDGNQQTDTAEQKRKDFVSSLLNVAAPGVVVGSVPPTTSVSVPVQAPIPNGPSDKPAGAKDDVVTKSNVQDVKDKKPEGPTKTDEKKVLLFQEQ
jgi:hypothetical protein